MAYQKRKWGQKKSWRIFKNEDIKAFTILVVDADGEKLWTMPRAKALAMASEKWLDLVQINYDASTKICTAKMVDFGKYQYENKKAESEKRKKLKSRVQKEIKFWYNIWDHDLDLKVRRAIDFLDKWHPLKINVVLKWREKAYKDIVRAKLDGVEEKLKAYGKSQWVKSENFGFGLIIIPSKRQVAQKQQNIENKRKKEEKERIQKKELKVKKKQESDEKPKVIKEAEVMKKESE